MKVLTNLNDSSRFQHNFIKHQTLLTSRKGWTELVINRQLLMLFQCLHLRPVLGTTDARTRWRLQQDISLVAWSKRFLRLKSRETETMLQMKHLSWEWARWEKTHFDPPESLSVKPTGFSWCWLCVCVCVCVHRLAQPSTALHFAGINWGRLHTERLFIIPKADETSRNLSLCGVKMFCFSWRKTICKSQHSEKYSELEFSTSEGFEVNHYKIKHSSV